jgi:hypothetical protein
MGSLMYDTTIRRMLILLIVMIFVALPAALVFSIELGGERENLKVHMRKN